jgi:hypothetical protein
MKQSILILVTLSLGLSIVTCTSCKKEDSSTTDATTNSSVVDVDSSYFTLANANITVTKIPCTLSDGTEKECYQIVTNSMPTDHQMGPWCPDNITDDASAGGIWLEGGEVYDVDGAFIEDMANFYNDNKWQMYDANGDIYTTDTEDDCINAANPNVGAEYENYCVECIPSYINNISQTFIIPVTPVLQTNAVHYSTGPGGPMSDLPSVRGVALNGIEYSAPAPVSNILAAYTLAPFDDAGGHINVHQGYHYHAATGISFSIAQNDGHADLIGYALDGHGIYGQKNSDGEEPSDLDDCRGHYDDVRGYHYHVDAAGSNNFINCLQGAYAN